MTDAPQPDAVPWWRTLLAAILLGGAGAYLIVGDNKGLGIFAVLVAAILCRVLVLGVRN